SLQSLPLLLTFFHHQVLLRAASLGATGVPHFDDHLEEYIGDGSPALPCLSVLPTAVPYSVF
ncbi:hypothetical protein ATANTOWER_019143, partial [Ataeniobius toweri]|nr:hypothetical protein [Ataeniobius toweri]